MLELDARQYLTHIRRQEIDRSHEFVTVCALPVNHEAPVPGSRSVWRTIELTDASLATSGDYRNYFEHDGQRYSHTIDPRTGRPITHALVSVSVVAENAMHADAMATALLVMGPRDGYALALDRGLAAYFITADESGSAHYDRIDATISSEGPNSILGHGVIVHAGQDDLTSQPTGAAGPRVGCGVVGLAAPAE